MYSHIDKIPKLWLETKSRYTLVDYNASFVFIELEKEKQELQEGAKKWTFVLIAVFALHYIHSCLMSFY